MRGQEVAGGLPRSLLVSAMVVLVLATLALAGAVAGTVHGAVLVRMLKETISPGADAVR